MLELVKAMRQSLKNYRKQGIEPTLAQWIDAYEASLLSEQNQA